MPLRKVIVALLLVLVTGACETARQQHRSVPFDPEYTHWTAVLSGFVGGEQVDYTALKADRASLDAFIDQLATISPEELGRMTRDEKMAFWVNAYNGITLRSVVDSYPVSSIKEIDGVWKKQLWLAAGRKLTLDQIEHEILRPEYKDPRVHFAVNCASIGCPRS